MIAFDTLNPAKHGRMRPPAIPEKLDHGNYNRERNAGNGAEHSYTREAGHREPKLPALIAIDAAEVGHFNQANRGRDDDRSQSCVRQMLERVGRQPEQQ